MKKLTVYFLAINLFLCIPLNIGLFMIEKKEREKQILTQKKLRIDFDRNQNIIAQATLYILNNANFASDNSLETAAQLPFYISTSEGSCTCARTHHGQ